MSKECRLCKKEFGFFTFKYICTACGHSFCSGCASNSISLTAEDVIDYGDVKAVKSSPNKPLRCCQTCFDRVKNKNSSPATTSSPAQTSNKLSIKKPSGNTFLDKYSLGNNLGEGAFAVVKEGVKKDTNSKVAIKIINRAKLSNADEKSISQEVKILGSLEHPNIVKLHEFFEEPTSYYMVMECIEGGELFDRIVQKTAYSEKEARDLAFVLLNTLKYCHDRNIVHRDLKPENLLLATKDDDAQVKLVDFGFAIEVDGFSADEKVGTPGYIAPEILEGKKYGKPVDMWSFGVILYILLGGYPPFYDADSQVLYRKIMKGSFQFHHDYWCNISNGAKDLIRNLLVTNPYSRYNVTDALNHPWIKATDDSLANRKLDANLAQLKKFQATKKLKAGVKAVMAINKMKRLATALSKPDSAASTSTATAAAPATVAPKTELPRTINSRYTIGKVLGEGGYAVVKLGTSKVTHDEVAIKIVDRKKMTKKHEDGLRVEVAILQSLEHPNIVRAIDFFEDASAYYVVMELICGGELFDRIVKKTCYTEKEARDLVRVLLTAIKYMHDKNIVHRDLKPENLLLTSESNDADVKIVDFGFAANVEGNSLTSHCGTPGYIAPEILQNVPYGKAIDMWSFGVILYILLGGYPPFYDKNDQLLYRKIMKGQYQFHADYWGQVSEDAKDLIRHLLVVNPNERLTVDQALAHPWLLMGDENLGARDLTNSLNELRKFQIRKKLRSGMKAVLSVARMRLLVQHSKGSSSALTPAAEGAIAAAVPAVDPVEYADEEEINVDIPEDAIVK